MRKRRIFCRISGVMIQFLLAIIYLAFISLGLPDSILGAAWPTMYRELGSPVSYAGYVSMVIALGTIVSSLLSDRLTRLLGAGKVTAISVAMTAAALFGFSMSSSYWMLLLWAVPYGLGAGSVDAALNNYVALHYESRHMSWLHCMWGIGAMTGPFIMGQALTFGFGWSRGYQFIGILQVLLTVVLFFSLPAWKEKKEAENVESGRALSLLEIVKLKGVLEVMVFFFGYCAFEQAAGLWASSFLNLAKNVPATTAASFGALFFVGITLGRGASGFITMRFSDHQMIVGGLTIMAAGLLLMLLPFGSLALLGLVVIGLGCAPIYPCVIHSTPFRFGSDKSQAVIGVEMASAYLGTLVMPALFGFIAERAHISFLPFYLFAILVVMAVMYAKLVSRTGK